MQFPPSHISLRAPLYIEKDKSCDHLPSFVVICLQLNSIHWQFCKIDHSRRVLNLFIKHTMSDLNMSIFPKSHTCSAEAKITKRIKDDQSIIYCKSTIANNQSWQYLLYCTFDVRESSSTVLFFHSFIDKEPNIWLQFL